MEDTSAAKDIVALSPSLIKVAVAAAVELWRKALLHPKIPWVAKTIVAGCLVSSSEPCEVASDRKEDPDYPRIRECSHNHLTAYFL